MEFPNIDVQLTLSEFDLYLHPLFQVLKKCGFDNAIRKQIKSYKGNDKRNSEYFKQVHSAILYYGSKELLDRFVKFGYLNKIRTNALIKGIRVGFTADEFIVTEKGIDIALKLQEHKDNERRHNSTVSYSKKAFGVSVVALIITFIALTLAFIRLERTDQILEKTERRLSLAEENLRSRR